MPAKFVKLEVLGTYNDSPTSAEKVLLDSIVEDTGHGGAGTCRFLFATHIITLTSSTLSANSTETVTGSATNSYITDLNATDDDGDSIYQTIMLGVYRFSYGIPGNPTFTVSGNTMTISVTLRNVCSTSYAVTVIYRIAIYKYCKCISQGY